MTETCGEILGKWDLVRVSGELALSEFEESTLGETVCLQYTSNRHFYAIIMFF